MEKKKNMWYFLFFNRFVCSVVFVCCISLCFLFVSYLYNNIARNQEKSKDLTVLSVFFGVI